MSKTKTYIVSCAAALISVLAFTMTATAAINSGSIEVKANANNGYTKNCTNYNRYGNIRYTVYNLTTWAVMGTDFNEGKVNAGNSIYAYVYGYTGSGYGHYAHGCLYNGLEPASGMYTSDTDQDY